MPEDHDSMLGPRYAGVPTFMRTPLAGDLSQLDIALVGVPYDGATEARPGARHGPRQIRDLSSMMPCDPSPDPHRSLPTLQHRRRR